MWISTPFIYGYELLNCSMNLYENCNQCDTLEEKLDYLGGIVIKYSINIQNMYNNMYNFIVPGIVHVFLG